MMSMVFDRYPAGGGEYVLALALADHASEDGRRIWPGVESLAAKSRQSVRTVQRQLIAMQEAGWLLLVKEGGKGPKDPNEYCINPDWINGAEFESLKNKGDILSPLDSANKGDIAVTPLDEKKGDIAVTPLAVDNSELRVTSETLRVTKTAIKGDIAVSPESSLTIIKAIDESRGCARELLVDQGVPVEIAERWISIRLEKLGDTSGDPKLTEAAIDLVKPEALLASITFVEAIACCCENNWAWFKASWFKKLGCTSQGPPKPSTGEIWRDSAAGVLSHGKWLGVEPQPDESVEAFKLRVEQADWARAKKVASEALSNAKGKIHAKKTFPAGSRT
jgi:hypothetical protein